MKSLLARLRDALGLELIEQRGAGILCVRKSKGLYFKVTVSYEVLEWFVDAHDGSGAIWSDWADYYAIDCEKREQLVSEMALDLERCVTVLANAQIRVLHDQINSKRYIELKVGGSWQRASLIWLTGGANLADAQ